MSSQSLSLCVKMILGVGNGDERVNLRWRMH